MHDREKIIKAFEECLCKGHDFCSKCYQEGPGLGFVCKNNVCLEVLSILKEQKPCWILCSDKLPKSNPEDLEYPAVIIALKDGTVELGCYYESTKEWGAGENFDRPRQPVAWMPLPELYSDRR